jgi:hypothetical protein
VPVSSASSGPIEAHGGQEVSGQVEMQVPDDWDHSTELQATFVANFMGLALQPGQSYTWSLEIDGKELAGT